MSTPPKSSDAPVAASSSSPQQKPHRPPQPRHKPQHADQPAAPAASGGDAAAPAAAAATAASDVGSASAPHHAHHGHHTHHHAKKPHQHNVPKPKKPQPAKNPVAVAPSGLKSVLLHPSFSSLQLLDIGANLTDGQFTGHYRSSTPKHPGDLGAVLERAAKHAVKRVIVTAGSAKEGTEVMELIESCETQAAKEGLEFPLLYSTVGVHPTRSSQWNGNEKHQQKYFDSLFECIIRGLGSDGSAASAVASSSGGKLASRQVVVAVGECGLDYDRLHFSDRESQLRHFPKHFELVERVAAHTAHWKGGPVHLPLFLHDRNTGGDFHALMQSNRHRFKHGVVHSFTGSIDEVKALLSLDLHIGINGCSLKLVENLAVLDHIPLNRLMLETDAPWCEIRNTHASSPLVSTRLPMVSRPEQWEAGKGVKGRNEPAAMVQVLEVVAAHLGMDPIELAQVVWQNTIRVFFPREFEELNQNGASALPAAGASATTSSAQVSW